MKINNNKRKYLAIIFIMLFVLSILLSACDPSASSIQGLSGAFNAFKGELIGNDYTITQWDNYGNLTITLHGDKIAMNTDKDSDGELKN